MSIKHHLLLKIALFIFIVFFGLRAEAQSWTKTTDTFIDRFNQQDKTYSVTLNDSIIERVNYWSSFDLDHKAFILDENEFRRNQVMTLNTNYWNYKEHVMSLKFYPYKDLNIKYEPTLVRSKLLHDDRGYLDVMAEGSDFNEAVGEVYSMVKRNEMFFIKSPNLVRHVWKTIPEPHRLITDRKHLDMRSAEEGISGLLFGKVDSPTKLNKTIKEKGPWTFSGVENIQLSQAYLSNWTKGGENSIALQSDLLLRANYKKEKVEWENYARHKVGILNSESYPVQVNTDQIVANSKYGLKASKKWYYSFVFDFTSQLFNGYNNKKRESIISGFMSPAYFTFAVGMDYKQSKNFTLLLSPLTSKITYVKDTAKVDPGRYKIDKGKKVAYDTGASLNNHFNWQISTELNLKYKLDVFVGYFDKDPVTQVDWEVIFDMRINQHLSTRISPQLRYFKNESLKVQFREHFAINFSYKF
ncbi:Protein of unknown function [Saccharicrinis carchari]|uniref:DUF3078 domain-containing protein n=1 Tax=Saccharicrinis carchari TaxID=1168039 RepID=A0A521E1U3_SACCC|nr:DUF3078 domain-containing protein [Saccharicrinis carchari]SMO77947.1 Protein of unknown function [Saccharicrinis carchari]